MKTIYAFVPAGDDHFFVDAAFDNGGRMIWRVAEIVEARSANPGLIIKTPLGVDAIEQIIKQMREKFGRRLPDHAELNLADDLIAAAEGGGR